MKIGLLFFEKYEKSQRAPRTNEPNQQTRVITIPPGIASKLNCFAKCQAQNERLDPTRLLRTTQYALSQSVPD